jgi:hypothetical protein
MSYHRYHKLIGLPDPTRPIAPIGSQRLSPSVSPYSTSIIARTSASTPPTRTLETAHNSICIRGATLSSITPARIGSMRQDFQFGHFNSTDSATTYTSDWFQRVTFPVLYDDPPNVVVWLNELNIVSTGSSWRVLASPSEITKSSFMISINTWGDTTFISAAAYWIAFPSNHTAFLSDTFTRSTLRPWPKWTLKNQLSVKFDRPFSGTPRVSGVQWAGHRWSPESAGACLHQRRQPYGSHVYDAGDLHCRIGPTSL